MFMVFFCPERKSVEPVSTASFCVHSSSCRHNPYGRKTSADNSIEAKNRRRNPVVGTGSAAVLFCENSCLEFRMGRVCSSRSRPSPLPVTQTGGIGTVTVSRRQGCPRPVWDGYSSCFRHSETFRSIRLRILCVSVASGALMNFSPVIFS